jgi:hypothetical protein
MVRMSYKIFIDLDLENDCKSKLQSNVYYASYYLQT